ncbi:polysaccharide pyruvyl transferase family protein [Moritella yayanosii]|uniref:Polysaccharide pyruvyl transferase domain-containing protein n=1 Tax=Moritella yayanosii TaxID=69539 RepID=A0A330LV53_9GAMM|nr:polysaccharide pyruvyl transferase family protein [Moritella yayanosii]SQD80122.1 protein of unknown function, containing conserved domain of Polysaccharide pyruvyl transferase [Moritella yayanosii]
MKKILALYAYADYNKGDSAICLGAKKLLEKIYPDADVVFANFLSSDHDYSVRARGFYSNYGIEVVDIPSRNLNKINKLSRLITMRDHNVNLFLQKEKYDLVISIGGHFLFSKDSSLHEKVRNKLRLQHIYQPIVEAKKCGIKTGILCQSVGPFNKADRVIKKVFDSLDFVITRESKSALSAKKHYKDVVSAIDMAFFMDSDPSPINKLAVDSSDYYVVNLRKVLASGGYEVSDVMYKKQIEFFVKTITKLISDKKSKVYLLSQVTSFDEKNSEFDSNIHYELKDKYFKNNCDVIVEPRVFTERELIKIYQDSKGLISTRYHGLIFGLLAGVNPVGVNIEGIGHKLTGMFDDLDIKENIIQLDDESTEESSSKVVELLSKPTNYDVEAYVNKNFEAINNAIR